jgi:hypothetical protein
LILVLLVVLVGGGGDNKFMEIKQNKIFFLALAI